MLTMRIIRTRPNKTAAASFDSTDVRRMSMTSKLADFMIHEITNFSEP